MNPLQPDKQVLIDIVTMKMPFGKYQGRLICDLPEHYLVWFKNKGFPPGKLGELMANTYEFQLNGLMPILYKIKRMV